MLRKQKAAVNDAERRKQRRRQRDRMEALSNEAVRSMAHHDRLKVSPSMGFAMSSLGAALTASRSSDSLSVRSVSSVSMYGYPHNIGSGYGYSNHGLTPSGHHPTTYGFASNRASAASLVDTDLGTDLGADLGALSHSESAINNVYRSTSSASLPGLGGMHGGPSGSGAPDWGLRSGGPSMTSIHTTGGTSIVSNATILGSRTTTLPRAALLQAERVINAAARESDLRRSASSSIIGLPTNTHVLKDPVANKGVGKAQALDHLAELWMAPRMGPYAQKRVAAQQALPFTPSFLPPLSHTQIRPIRPPVLSPSASQKTIEEFYSMHENKIFGDRTLVERIFIKRRTNATDSHRCETRSCTAPIPR